MKYLRRYNETIGHSNYVFKPVIEDLLLDLRDNEFETQVTESDYTNQKDRIKIIVSKKSKFSYQEIRETIESIWDFLKDEGFKIEDFSYEYSRTEPEGNIFNTKTFNNSFSTTTDNSNKVWGSYLIPTIVNLELFNRDTRSWYVSYQFEISFIKDKIVVDRSISIREDLDPETYLRAADKLRQMGHNKRPDALSSWSEEMKTRTNNIYKQKAINEAKKLGEYNLNINGKTGKFYIYLSFDKDENEYNAKGFSVNDSRSRMITFRFGVIPIDEAANSIIIGDGEYYYSNEEINVTWLQYLNLFLSINRKALQELRSGEKGPELTRYLMSNDFTYLKHVVKTGEKIGENDLVPPGNIYLAHIDDEPAYFSTRRDATRFKKAIIDIFEGDIEFTPVFSNVSLKDDVLENLCSHDEYPISTRDFERFLDSLRFLNVNSLYRD